MHLGFTYFYWQKTVCIVGTIEVSERMGPVYVHLGSDPLVLTRAKITGVYHRSPPMNRDSGKGPEPPSTGLPCF